MERTVIRDKVVEKIHELLIVKIEITEDTYLIEDLDISSIEIMELIADLESEYHLTIPEDKLNQFVKIKDLVDYLDQNLNGVKDE